MKKPFFSFLAAVYLFSPEQINFKKHTWSESFFSASYGNVQENLLDLIDIVDKNNNATGLFLKRVKSKNFYNKDRNKKFEESFNEDYQKCYKKFNEEDKKALDNFYKKSFMSEKKYIDKPGVYQYEISNKEDLFAGYIAFTIFDQLQESCDNDEHPFLFPTKKSYNIHPSKSHNLLYIQLLFMCNDFKNKGHGSSVLHTVKKIMKDNFKIKTLHLDVRDINERGLKFYIEKNGAKKYEEKRFWDKLDSKYYNNSVWWDLEPDTEASKEDNIPLTPIKHTFAHTFDNPHNIERSLSPC